MVALEGEKPTHQNLWRAYGDYVREGRPKAIEDPTLSRLIRLCHTAPGNAEVAAIHFQAEPVPMFTVSLGRALGVDNFSCIVDTDLLRVSPRPNHPYAEISPLPNSPLLWLPQDFPVIIAKGADGLNIEASLPPLEDGWNQISARGFRDIPKVRSLLMRYG